MRWLLLLTLAACDPVTCATPLRLTRHRDPATGIYQVDARCGAAVIAAHPCADGGQVRVHGRRVVLMCDGSVLAVGLADSVTEVQP